MRRIKRKTGSDALTHDPTKPKLLTRLHGDLIPSLCCMLSVHGKLISCIWVADTGTDLLAPWQLSNYMYLVELLPTKTTSFWTTVSTFWIRNWWHTATHLFCSSCAEKPTAPSFQMEPGIGMKFCRNVNTQQMIGLDFKFDVTRSRRRSWRHFSQKSAATWWVHAQRLSSVAASASSWSVVRSCLLCTSAAEIDRLAINI